MITAGRIGHVFQRDNLMLANVLTTVDKSSVVCVPTAAPFSSLYPQPSSSFIPTMSHDDNHFLLRVDL